MPKIFLDFVFILAKSAEKPKKKANLTIPLNSINFWPDFSGSKNKIQQLLGHKLKKVGHFKIFPSSLAFEILKYSELASKILASIFLGSNSSGDNCTHYKILK